MRIDNIRFSTVDGLVVLQVNERKTGPYHYDTGGDWRNAKVEDLLDVADIIRRSQYQISHNGSEAP